MDQITLQIDVQDQSTIGLLSRIRLALLPTTLQEFMRVGVQTWLVKRIEDRFTSEGDDASGKWAPLRWSTQHIRSQLGYGAEHPINVRTGALKNWLTSGGTTAVNGADVSFTLPRASGDAELLHKLKIAQVGTTSFPGTHSRKVLAMSEVDYAGILERLNSWFVTEIGRPFSEGMVPV